MKQSRAYQDVWDFLQKIYLGERGAYGIRAGDFLIGTDQTMQGKQEMQK